MNAPDDGVEYKLTVSVERAGCAATAATASASRYYVKSPVEPQISYTHDCGEPITFKLDNSSVYPTTSNYSRKWMLDGVAVTPSSEQYSFSNFRDGDNFT